MDRLAAAQPPRRVLVIGDLSAGVAPAAGTRQPALASATRCDSPWAPSASPTRCSPSTRSPSGLGGGKFENLNHVLAAVRELGLRLAARGRRRPAPASRASSTASSLSASASSSTWRSPRRRCARTRPGRPRGGGRCRSCARRASSRSARSPPSRRAVAAELLPFPELRFGWGLDLHWSALAAAARLAPRGGRRARRCATSRRSLPAATPATTRSRRPPASWPTAPTCRARAPATRWPCTGAPDAPAVRVPRHAHRRRGAPLGHAASRCSPRAGQRSGLVCLSGEGPLFGALTRRRRAGGLPAHARARGSARLAARARLLAPATGRGRLARRERAAGRRGDRAARAARRTWSTSTRRSPPTASCSRCGPHQRRLTRLVAPRVDGVIAVARRQVEPLARLGYRARADRGDRQRGRAGRRATRRARCG